MAEADSTIVISIELDDGSIRKATVQADDLAKQLGGTIGGGISAGVDKSFTGLIVQFNFVADLAKKAFGSLSGILTTAIDEAASADSAVAEFNATLANAGQFSQEASQDFLNFASSLQKVGTVSDDVVIASAKVLVSIGKLSGEGLKEATTASINLSRGLGIDLATAFDLVAKAAAGNTGALSRYGLKVGEEIPKSERFANLLGQINQKFGGLDVGKANTFAGSVTQFRNAINDVFENIGKIVTQSPTLVAVIRVISEKINIFSSGLEGLAKQDPLRNLIIGFLEFAKILSTTVLPTVELVLNFVKFVFDALLTGISALGTGVSGIVNVFTQGLNAIGVVSDETAAKVSENFQSNLTVLNSLTESTAESFSQIGTNFEITGKVDTFISDLQRAADTAAPIGETLKNNIVKPLAEVDDATKRTLQAIGDLVANGFTNAISRGVQVLATNLAKGKNAFAGFTQTLVGIFGDLLIQVGTAIIATDVAIQALRNSIVTAGTIPALGAGIALIALGAALKAYSGGGGAGAVDTSVASAAGPGGVPANPDVVGATQPELDRERETKVAININGNVLDRRETGLEIASVLQEFFDTQDGVLVRS